MSDSEKKDQGRSYLNPEFDWDFDSWDEFKEDMGWNYDLAKRKIKKRINQYRADKEWKEKNPPKKKEPGLGLGRTGDLLKEVDD